MVTNNSEFFNNKLTNLDKIREHIKAPLNEKCNIVVFGDRFYTENIVNQLLVNLPASKQNIYHYKIDMHSFKTTKSLFVFTYTTICNRFIYKYKVIDALKHHKDRVNLLEIVCYTLRNNNKDILDEATKHPLLESIRVHTDCFICSMWWAKELLTIFSEIKERLIISECDSFIPSYMSFCESLSFRLNRFISRKNG